MKLSDEQLTEMSKQSFRTTAACTRDMARELLAMRQLKRAAEDVYNCQSPSTIAALKAALEKCDKATNAAKPQKVS